MEMKATVAEAPAAPTENTREWEDQRISVDVNELVLQTNRLMLWHAVLQVPWGMHGTLGSVG
jgi:hypothetical protein